MQRLDRHRGTQVRAADADVDDGGRTARRPSRASRRRARSSANSSMRSRSASTWRAMSSPPGRVGGHAGHAQRGVQHRAASVVLMASPRHIASMRARRSGGIGEAGQQAQAVVVDALAREVEVQAHGLAGEAAAARRIARRAARAGSRRGFPLARACRARQAAVRLSWAIGGESSWRNRAAMVSTSLLKLRLEKCRDFVTCSALGLPRKAAPRLVETLLVDASIRSSTCWLLMSLSTSGISSAVRRPSAL